ncbi:undecaprenyl-phosphate glucose phosphotransferase [Sulfuriferula sp. AH1]|uniref:undecaprenyl-phosphate glucose phosphotransferase n=1 Tax=Sulfuriferula sp. AH1 TaxID=1985873 RepID=UPI000B3B324A|nr:undecaprenyl-phosphate glucose phosphotransferase [Sulfuriferula sp. AH1]ARU32520.1 undecaprenyl-phosphate glucose phosphotransferase [Sulfuriferula sp. AH1]
MVGGYEHPALSLAKRLVNPLVIFVSLLIAVEVMSPPFNGMHLVLGVLAFLIGSQVFDGFEFFELRGQQARIGWHIVNLLIAWTITVGILIILDMATGMGDAYDRRMLMVWVVLTPVLLFASQFAVRVYLEALRKDGKIRRAIIVGANDLGCKLADRIHHQRSLMVRVDAFFDDRLDDRCDPSLLSIVAGGLDDVADYVTKSNIDLVYITLPILKQSRIVELVNSLRDTTASIYFVPDVFIFDLVQARLDSVNGVPVISVFESPLVGINAVHKRIFDLVVSGTILLMIAPIMVIIAALVKLTSKGPVFFKQRRYGMDGEEIWVYKFRSMSVCEDGDKVTQATKNDARVTRLGAILRKTSLDELPQLINVLQGSMSIVGPRPHAVAHNEHYRKLIQGYMWRHKVKPGITGWAQVNGYRGETDTIDKMEGRVLHDISYLKNWSIWLDITIMLKTIKLVFKDSQAY